MPITEEALDFRDAADGSLVWQISDEPAIHAVKIQPVLAPAFPAARAAGVERVFSVQSIPADGSFHAVSFDRIIYDLPGGMFTLLTPDRITITQSGLYACAAEADWPSSQVDTEGRGIIIQVSGGPHAIGFGDDRAKVPGEYLRTHVAMPTFIQSGQNLKCLVRSGISGGSRNLNYAQFVVALVGAYA
jgi:hypothetical protein